jgi:hypothetical protein
LNIYIAAFPEYDFDIPLAKAGWKRLIPGIVMLPFLGFWFYFFKIKGHSEKILMEFQNETKRAKFISSALVIIYGVGTILFFILSLFLRKHVLMH